MSTTTAIEVAVASDLEIDDQPRERCDYIDVYPDRVCCFRLLDLEWYVWLRCRVDRRLVDLPPAQAQALRDRWSQVDGIAKRVLSPQDYERAQHLRPDAHYQPPRPRPRR